jgi:hypothetical protein
MLGNILWGLFMKTKLARLAMFFSSVALAQTPYVSPLRITHFDRSGAALAWTNSSVCVNVPVYEVLRATSPTGSWQHFAFVTNAETTLLTNSLGEEPGAIFHKLAWVKDSPMLFDYAFDEGYGFISVTGRLSLNFCAIGTNFGTWFCENTEYVIDGEHPTAHNPCGHGLHSLCPPPREQGAWSGPHPFQNGGLGVSGTNYGVSLFFSGGSEGYSLMGSMRVGNMNGRQTFIGISGFLYLCGFASCDPIGSFVATRVP